MQAEAHNKAAIIPIVKAGSIGLEAHTGLVP